MFLKVNNIIKKLRVYQTKDILINNKSEVILSAFSQIALILQLILQNKILATYFSKIEFGNWSLLLSMYVLISMLPFTAFDQAIARLTFKKINSGEKYLFINSIYIVYITLFLLYLILTRILTKTFFFNSIFNEFFFSFIFYTFSEILKNSLIVVDNASRNRRRVLWSRVFDLFFRTILIILLSRSKLFSIDNVLLIFISGNIILILSSFKKFNKVIPFIKLNFIKDLYLKEIIMFSYPLMLWAFFGWLQSMVNRWYLSYYLDAEAVASYTILISLSFFLPNAFYGIVNNFFMPYIFSKDIKTTIKFYKNYLVSIGLILLLYIIFSIFAKEYFILILANKKYMAIAPLIPVLSMSSSIYILSMVSTFEIYRSGDTKILLLPTVTAGIIPTVIGYFVVGRFGLNGAIFNYILGQLVYASFVFRVSYKHLKGDIYNA